VDLRLMFDRLLTCKEIKILTMKLSHVIYGVIFISLFTTTS
jgi:hypothetical protein